MLTVRLPPFAASRPSVRRAVEWALVLHTDQRREVDRAPFVLHPLEVAALLNGRAFDDEVVTAGVLHDIIENSSVTVGDIERRFGVRVARLVAKVRELRARATRDPAQLHGRKLEHYRASLDMLRGCTDDLPLVDQLEFELWALDVLLPSQADNDGFTDR